MKQLKLFILPFNGGAMLLASLCVLFIVETLQSKLLPWQRCKVTIKYSLDKNGINHWHWQNMAHALLYHAFLFINNHMKETLGIIHITVDIDRDIACTCHQIPAMSYLMVMLPLCHHCEWRFNYMVTWDYELPYSLV